MSTTNNRDKVKPAEWHPHSSPECLPFDQYQRYRITEQIVNAVRWKKRLAIVDVGGHPGQVDLFLPDDDTYVLDERVCHAKHFVLGDACALPYKDSAFDVVINMDVLEHIAPERRPAFIDEQLRVCKRYLILGAPFASDAVSQAERIVYEYIGAKYGFEYDFLAEHLANGLPDLNEVCKTLDDRHLRYVTLPNGYLYNWLFMLLVHFSIEWTESTPALSAAIHQFYNSNFYQADNRTPSYRTILVIAKRAEKKLATLSKKIVCPPEQVNGDAQKLELANILLNVLELQKVRQGDRKIAELRVIVERYRNEAQTLEREKLEVQLRREDAERTVHEVSAELQTSRGESQALRQELQRASEESQDLQRRFEENLREAESAAEDVRQKLHDAREENQRERRRFEERIRDTEKAAEDLRNEADVLKEKFTSVSHECDLLEQKIKSLENDLQRTLQEKTEVEEDRDEEASRFAEEIEKMKQAEAVLRSEREDLHMAKEHYRNRVEILYGELRRKKKRRLWSKP